MLDVTNDAATPVVFPLRVGDTVILQVDVLAEQARHAPGLPPTWLMLPAHTEGKLLGYRDRAGESYAIIEISLAPKLVMFVRERNLVTTRREPRAPARGDAPKRVSSGVPRIPPGVHAPRLRRRSTR